jgi:hypothetical protein
MSMICDNDIGRSRRDRDINIGDGIVWIGFEKTIETVHTIALRIEKDEA